MWLESSIFTFKPIVVALTSKIPREIQSWFWFTLWGENGNSRGFYLPFLPQRDSHQWFSTHSKIVMLCIFILLFSFPFPPSFLLYRLKAWFPAPSVSKKWEGVTVFCPLKYTKVQMKKKDHKLQTKTNAFLIVNPSLDKSCITLPTCINFSKPQFSHP